MTGDKLQFQPQTEETTMTVEHENIALIDSTTFIMDGGLETTLIFENGYDLPEFAAFPLLDQKEGREILRNYYIRYISLARKNGYGFILEGPTWRASASWGEKLGYDQQQLDRINAAAINFLKQIRTAFAGYLSPILVSGNVGPRSDGYKVGRKMSVDESESYHRAQISQFKRARADMVSAYTINYVEEAIGIVKAAQKEQIPVVISFTVETDGRLPSGQPLGEAITQVDTETGAGPAYYMINCAHPSHFREVLTDDQDWLGRIKAVRSNASKKSHAELDEAEELDRGDLSEFGQSNAELIRLLPNLHIFGGCCGTDHHHVEEICKNISEQAATA